MATKDLMNERRLLCFSVKSVAKWRWTKQKQRHNQLESSSGNMILWASQVGLVGEMRESYSDSAKQDSCIASRVHWRNSWASSWRPKWKWLAITVSWEATHVRDGSILSALICLAGERRPPAVVLTLEHSEDLDRRDGIPRLFKHLTDVGLHGAHHAEAKLLTFNVNRWITSLFTWAFILKMSDSWGKGQNMNVQKALYVKMETHSQ